MKAARFVALPSDAEIVNGLRSGDSRVLEALVLTYWGPLTRYAGRILERGDDGEDAVQEVFIRLWTRRTDLSRKGSLRSLLYAMTRNAAIDRRRYRTRHAARAAQSDPPVPSASPLEAAAETELAERAAAAVAALPERRREVFRLVREEGLSYREVGGVMGISLQTVANHMSLALAALRDVLCPSTMVEGQAGLRVMDGEGRFIPQRGRDERRIDHPGALRSGRARRGRGHAPVASQV